MGKLVCAVCSHPTVRNKVISREAVSAVHGLEQGRGQEMATRAAVAVRRIGTACNLTALIVHKNVERHSMFFCAYIAAQRIGARRRVARPQVLANKRHGLGGTVLVGLGPCIERVILSRSRVYKVGRLEDLPVAQDDGDGDRAVGVFLKRHAVLHIRPRVRRVAGLPGKSDAGAEQGGRHGRPGRVVVERVVGRERRGRRAAVLGEHGQNHAVGVGIDVGVAGQRVRDRVEYDSVTVCVLGVPRLDVGRVGVPSEHETVQVAQDLLALGHQHVN